jgi:phosphotransferase family enzyme
VDRRAADDWIRRHVDPVGEIEVAHERPWSTVLRVPVHDGVVWFKECGDVQRFEPRLSADLFARWPDRVGEVLAHDEREAWLLLADAGEPVAVGGNPPEAWLGVLPSYAELQRGEVAHATEQLGYGVTDGRAESLARRFEEALRTGVPLEDDEVATLRAFVPRLAELCRELRERGVPDSIQHDDLHAANLFVRDGRTRVLDWGDASIGHPFASLVVTYRFLEERNGLAPSDPWFTRLRDAYLEPWGRGLEQTFALAIRVGAFAHGVAWARQRDHLSAAARVDFDPWYAVILRRALREADAAPA